MNQRDILEKLPYTAPFLFVDALHTVSDHGVEGSFTFREDLDFYKGHFKGYPVTPGVILLECCAQIGLVCHGLYLLSISNTLSDLKQMGMALSSSEMEFLKPVFPNETVFVKSVLVYFRFQKLKCKVKMYNKNDEVVCKGTLSGMILDHGKKV